MRRIIVALPLLLSVSGCDLAPAYVRPIPAVALQDTVSPSKPSNALGQSPSLPWRSVFKDARLQAVIDQALANSQNLRVTVANVAAAQAQYHVERSAQLPTIAAGADASITRGINDSRKSSDEFDYSVGLSGYEIDLFGRLKNQTRQAFEQYLATEEGARAARIALVSEIASAYVTLASDQDLLLIAKDTLKSGSRSLELTEALHDSGLAALPDVSQAETLVQQARSDTAQLTTQVAQDRNALELLAGSSIAGELLPGSLADLDTTIGDVPAGLSSDVLLARPDVLQAEHGLKGANAGIGAARAAFFPSINLTAGIGAASTALSSLFTGGAMSFNLAPSAGVPLIGGPSAGNLALAKAQRDSGVAQYQLAVQTAFRDVANGLARRDTINDQRTAQAGLVASAATSSRLAEAQYRAGTDTFLDALIAQRTLYSARQSQIATILSDLSNRISLYQAVGSDFVNSNGVSAAQSPLSMDAALDHDSRKIAVTAGPAAQQQGHSD